MPDAAFGCPDLTTFCRLDELGLAEGRRVLINDPGRLNGVKVSGVDEHVWRHTRRGDKYVTVIIDLTPVRAGTGPARLLDMIPGRSKAAFKAWLTQRPQAWREAVEVVAMDGYPDPAAGRELMVKLIESLSAGVPRPLVEIAKLGRTLSKRAADVRAYFDRPGTSNGPTEAINGRLEHLRGSALGFRNLTNYIARSLLETGGFRPRLHPASVKSRSSWGSAKDTTETGNQ